VVTALRPPAVVDDGQRDTVALEDLQPLFDVVGAGDGLDAGLGLGAAMVPVGEGASLAGFDQADRMSVLDRRERESDGERAFAAAALLGGQNDRVHHESLKVVCGKRGLRQTGRLRRYGDTSGFCLGVPGRSTSHAGLPHARITSSTTMIKCRT